MHPYCWCISQKKAIFAFHVKITGIFISNFFTRFVDLKKCVLSILREKEEKNPLFKPAKRGGKVTLAHKIAGRKQDGEKLSSAQTLQKALGFAVRAHSRHYLGYTALWYLVWKTYKAVLWNLQALVMNLKQWIMLYLKW